MSPKVKEVFVPGDGMGTFAVFVVPGSTPWNLAFRLQLDRLPWWLQLIDFRRLTYRVTT